MRTANFKTGPHEVNAVAICLGVPVWFKGRHYTALAPTREMLTLLILRSLLCAP